MKYKDPCRDPSLTSGWSAHCVWAFSITTGAWGGENGKEVWAKGSPGLVSDAPWVLFSPFSPPVSVQSSEDVLSWQGRRGCSQLDKLWNSAPLSFDWPENSSFRRGWVCRPHQWTPRSGLFITLSFHGLCKCSQILSNDLMSPQNSITTDHLGHSFLSAVKCGSCFFPKYSRTSPFLQRNVRAWESQKRVGREQSCSSWSDPDPASPHTPMGRIKSKLWKGFLF